MRALSVLFVSHDATRTGAPIVLLTFLRWLRVNTNHEITILLKAPGELYKEFEATGETFCWTPNTPAVIKHDIISRIKRKVKKVNYFIPFPPELEKKAFDLVYLNTVVSLDLAPLLKEKFKCPVIAHVHENDFTIKMMGQYLLGETYTQAVDRFIVVSKSTKQNLQVNYLIPANKIDLVYEFIRVSDVMVSNIDTEELKKQLGLAKHEFVVGGSGFVQWRKGVDLFLYTAACIKRNYPGENIKFVWVGHLSAAEKEMQEYELERLGLTDKVIFAGTVTSPGGYFQCFDVFFLSSREDPFPLVCLEAAALQKPVLCFRDAGGINEFIEGGGGLSVEYGNVEAAAKTIVQFKNNETAKREMGLLAARNVAQYDVEIVAPLIMNIISQLCSN